MACGVPVIAANVGGMPEAKLGVPYLLPVNPIQRYSARVDERMVPVAETPPQDIGPWREALGRLLTDREHYAELSRESRAAAMAYVGNLSAEPFEKLLQQVMTPPRKPRPQTKETSTGLSPEKRKLMAIRLRKRAPASAWFPGIDEKQNFRLFWFPHAGGGAAQAPSDLPFVCPVLLPGREARMAEAPFEKMSSLIPALADAFEHYLNIPFAFFGHSMGAGVAFELTREFRRRSWPLPQILIASAARAPRLRWTPPPEITQDQFREELRRLSGAPPDLWNDPTIFGPLEADARLYRGYVYTDDAPLPCPIRAYGGADDPSLGREHLEPWACETTASFALRMLPGGHFYLQQNPDEFRRNLKRDLNQTEKR
jgi:surfactin synthase thioesterase subunit